MKKKIKKKKKWRQQRQREYQSSFFSTTYNVVLDTPKHHTLQHCCYAPQTYTISAPIIKCAFGVRCEKRILFILINIEKLEAALEEYERSRQQQTALLNNGFALHEATRVYMRKNAKTLHPWPKVNQKDTSNKFNGVSHIKSSDHRGSEA